MWVNCQEGNVLFNDYMTLNELSESTDRTHAKIEGLSSKCINRSAFFHIQ